MKRFSVMLVFLMAAIVPSPVLAADEGAELEGKYGVVSDSVMNARLQKVGARVILGVRQLYPKCGKQLRFKILGDQDMNACALKDGRIYVTQGMMQALANRSDDELAGVLDHEATHIVQGHHSRQLKKTIWGAVGTAALVWALGGDSDDVKTGAQVGGVLVGSQYSKDDEYRADAGAVDLLGAEGYDPMAMSQTLKLLKTKYGNGMAKTPVIGWFASHPDTGKRIEGTTKRAQNLLAKGQPAKAIAMAPAAPSAAKVGQVLAPPQKHRVAVIVKDNYSNGWGGFWGGQPANVAIQDAMTNALEQTGRFIVVDRDSRQDAWQEQDLGQTGRMDPDTVPKPGKTKGASDFLYISLAYYQVVQEGEFQLGNWNKGAKTRIVKAEIRGKARFVPTEESIVAQTADFIGSEMGQETEVEYNSWTRGSARGRWSTHPAGQAVEKACRKVAAELARKVGEQEEFETPVSAAVTPVSVPSLELGLVQEFTINIRSDDWKGPGDERKTTIHFRSSWETLLTHDVVLLGDRGQGPMVVATLRVLVGDTSQPLADAALVRPSPYYRDLNLSGVITAKFVLKD